MKFTFTSAASFSVTDLMGFRFHGAGWPEAFANPIDPANPETYRALDLR